MFPGVAQVDLYGSTEAGYIFVGDAFRNNWQVIDGNVFVERVKRRAELPAVFQLSVTTRDREAMPLRRYFTADIVRRTPTGYRMLGRDRDLFLIRRGA